MPDPSKYTEMINSKQSQISHNLSQSLNNSGVDGSFEHEGGEVDSYSCDSSLSTQKSVKSEKTTCISLDNCKIKSYTTAREGKHDKFMADLQILASQDNKIQVDSSILKVLYDEKESLSCNMTMQTICNNVNSHITAKSRVRVTKIQELPKPP
jgi:hypothetical protein